MLEPLLIRVRELETSNRRWKALCAILATSLAALLVSGGVFFGFAGSRVLAEQHRAIDAMEQARMQEMIAREQALRAEQQARQALEEIEKQKNRQ
jgi:peroxiredoxin family protein